MPRKKGLVGRCTFFSETGTEGGDWAFQDEHFIKLNTTQFYCKNCFVFWDKEKNPDGPAPIKELGGAIELTKMMPLNEATVKAVRKGTFKEPKECRLGQHEFKLTTKEFYLYEGFHILRGGDYLTIYLKEDPNKIVWQGKISLKQYPSFTQAAHGLWIHADQKGVDRETWAKYFMEEYPSKLTKRTSAKK